MKDLITIEGRDGAFGVYIARPKTLPAPAVVVLQELFGVTPTFAKPATNWRKKASLRSRQTCSGGRSRVST
jgi:dienelactone hydrolase